MKILSHNFALVHLVFAVICLSSCLWTQASLWTLPKLRSTYTLSLSHGKKYPFLCLQIGIQINGYSLSDKLVGKCVVDKSLGEAFYKSGETALRRVGTGNKESLWPTTWSRPLWVLSKPSAKIETVRQRKAAGEEDKDRMHWRLRHRSPFLSEVADNLFWLLQGRVSFIFLLFIQKRSAIEIQIQLI